MNQDPTVASPGPGAIVAAGGRWLPALASLKLTLAVLVALALGVSLAYDRQGEGEATWPLVGPLLLLAINLAAAVLHNRNFRRQGALLVFHLTLLAIVVLVALGRLSYLRGTTEIVTGGEFEGLILRDAGPWHSGNLDAVHFRNEGFRIDYAPGRLRRDTVNRVSWRDDSGMPRQADIGDQVPLVVHGYRFYTTHNKGFAPVFLWRPRNGEPRRGGVHLPAFPAHQFEQAQQWHVDGMRQPVWVKLEVGEKLLDPERADEFRLPRQHRVVVRVGDQRAELQPGQRIEVPDGDLVYEGLGTWMGYGVFYDWTIPWLLAACVLAVASLAWHFQRRYFSRPWREHD